MEKSITTDSNKLRKQFELLVQKLNGADYDRRTYLLGRVLTVTDAAIPDPAQRKAVKNLVEEAFWGDSAPGQTSWVEYPIVDLAKAYNIPELWSDSSRHTQPLADEPKNDFAEIK